MRIAIGIILFLLFSSFYVCNQKAPEPRYRYYVIGNKKVTPVENMRKVQMDSVYYILDYDTGRVVWERYN